MGYRWDVGKRFFAVTHADFRQGVDIVQRLMENFTAQPSVLSVDFYNQLKYGAAPATDPRSEILIDQLNAPGIFKTVRDTKDILRADWKKAAYVEAVIRPEKPVIQAEGLYCFATIEAKGLLPRRMNFHVQGFGVGAAARQQIYRAFRSWRHGDGNTPNHHVFMN